MGLKVFFFAFTLCTVGGALTLRWLALDFLYSAMDTFVSGIGSTLVSSVVLAVGFSCVLWHWLKKIEKIGEKVKASGEVTEEERKIVLSAYRKALTFIIFENACGFIIGQLICMIVDFKAGVFPYEFSRAFIIMIQATLVGIIAAMYESYYLDTKLAAYRDLLELRSIKAFPGKTHTISRRILVICVVTLLFMGLNSFSCAYSILHGDNMIEGQNLMSEYFARGIRCIILISAECVGLITIVLKEMRNRLSNTAELVTNLAESGDISRRINISMNDDIAVVISSLNFFLDKLEAIVINLSTDSSAVSDVAMILEESASKSVEALRVVKDAVNFIDSQDKHTNEQIKKAYNDLQSVKDNAASVVQHIQKQTEAVTETSDAVTAMNASIDNVVSISRMATEVSSNLKSTSSSGSLAIQKAIQAIEQIQAASSQIQDIIKMIQKIASQTNLLSMNASIEAAHAGAYGTGFAVVANEVRSLANTSAKNAKTIKDHMQDMTDKIENGVELIKEAGRAFSEIDSGVEESASIVAQIREAAEQQKAGAADTMQATDAVVNAISNISAIAKEQSEHAQNVFDVMLNIVNSSQEISNALAKTSESVENVNVSLTDVEDCSRINKISVQSMNDHISLFKLAQKEES